jgi:hypothetical protein
MNSQYRLTLIGAVTGSALTLAVSLILYFVAQSRQRRLWILDSKKAEWKELIGALCQSARCMLDNSPILGYTNAINVKTGDQERRSYEADSEREGLFRIASSLQVVSEKRTFLSAGNSSLRGKT